MADEYVDMSNGNSGGLDDGPSVQQMEAPESLGITDLPGDHEGVTEGDIQSEVDGLKGSWMAGLSADEREYAKSKGFDDPARVLRSQREAEAQMFRMQKQMDQLTQGFAQQPAQQQPQSQAEPADFVTQQFQSHVLPVLQAVDAGEIDPGQGMAIVWQTAMDTMGTQMQAVVDYTQQQMDERLAPYTQKETVRGFRDQAETLKREYGPVWGEIAPEARQILQQEIQRNPAAAQDPESLNRAVEKAAAARYRRMQMEAQAQTLDRPGGSGRGRTRVDEAQRIWDEIDEAMGFNSGIPMHGGL